MNRLRAAASASLVAILIAACSAASPGAEETEEPTPTPTPATEPSEDGSGPSFAPGAGDLDSLLPDLVGGIALGYQFAQGQGVVGSDGITPEIQASLDRMGADMDDVSFAFGYGIDQAIGYISIFAIQVVGADGETLRDEFQQSMMEDSDSVATETSLAGKDVTAFGTAGQDPDGYMYVHDDVVFMVAGSTPELTVEALSLLP